MRVLTLSLGVLFALTSIAHAELDTVTYIDASGGAENNAGRIPDGRVEGDTSGKGEVTLIDVEGGDMWNGGDQFIYLHEASARPTSEKFLAVVRVVGQTEAVDGRWGKAGIHARNSLDGNAGNAMAQLATGNGSQADAPANGDHSPVPARLGGRRQNDGNGGFENGIPAHPSTRQDVDGDGNIANNTFQSAGTVSTWLALYYEPGTGFRAGTALDVNGAPGAWSFSDPVGDIPTTRDGWYLGLGYSAHSDLVPVDPDGFHGVTFDGFRTFVPEPTSVGLILLGAMGVLGFARRCRR